MALQPRGMQLMKLVQVVGVMVAAMTLLSMSTMAFVPSNQRTTIVTTTTTSSSRMHSNRFMSVIPSDQVSSHTSQQQQQQHQHQPQESLLRKRFGFLEKLGFSIQHKDRATSVILANNNNDNNDEQDAAATTTKTKHRRRRHVITTVPDLDDYFQDTQRRFRNNKKDQHEVDYDSLLNSLSVMGDTQIIGSTQHLDYVHPVVQLLHERRRNNNNINNTRDGCKIALAIEGGGMRGCVSAGMASAIHYLNLTDSIDVVYGSSAGSIVGSYLITRQLPWFGPEVYYDQLTMAGRSFIDTSRLLRSMGLGLLDPRLVKDVVTRPNNGKPVLNLAYLLETTLQTTKPLDWNRFVTQQQYSKQPLKVVASALKSQQSIVLDMEHGSFSTLPELAQCMRASCLLPGIAGPMMNLNRTAVANNNTGHKFILGNGLTHDELEPLADSLLYEPLPYRSAIQQGATHVIVLRSRPDGVDVSGKSSLVERLIFQRFLLRKNWLPQVYQYLRRHGHKQCYSQDVLTLNAHANSTRHYRDTTQPHLLTVALPPGSVEVTKLETGRLAIFEGLRRGFARAYDALVEDPSQRGRGAIVAQQVFPNEILDYDPMDYMKPTLSSSSSSSSTTESAFAMYLQAKQQQQQQQKEKNVIANNCNNEKETESESITQTTNQ